MKWNKFKELLQTHSWLVSLIDPHGHMRHDPQTMTVQKDNIGRLRPFVRNQIEHLLIHSSITQRHLEEIFYAKRGYYETMTSSGNALTTDPYYGGAPNKSYDEEWHVVWCVGGREKSASQIQEVSAYDTCLDILNLHEKGCFAKGELDFSHIVKVTKVTSRPLGSLKVTIEAFVLPQFWSENVRRFEVLEPGRLQKRSRHEIEATHAYLAGGAMPPIVPDITWRRQHGHA